MKTLDYRRPENRHAYFTKLYELNLEEGILPGLVYKLFPELRRRYGWSHETALWYAFLNGMTQNPLTSLVMLRAFPEVPRTTADLTNFENWFNATWKSLPFDNDRRHQKADTPKAVWTYSELLHGGSQMELLANKPFSEVWGLVTKKYYSFGRLSSWSYLEYVKIMLGPLGADADRLFFEEKYGSRSHRNGMLFLLGRDQLVFDKRMPNNFDGKFADFPGLCSELQECAEDYLNEHAPRHPDAGMFTLESNLCTFKNHFFGIRYPGIYVDMHYDRIKRHELIYGQDHVSQLMWDIRSSLEGWMRNEVRHDGLSIRQRGAVFPATGFPYRGEYFL